MTRTGKLINQTMFQGNGENILERWDSPNLLITKANEVKLIGLGERTLDKLSI